MKLETGYVYHIKNEFFEFAQDNKLMKNHEGNATRPNYLCIKKDDSNLLWFIPMSGKVDKYNKIMQQKIKKNGVCDTIIIGKYRNRETAFLIQNMFPVTEKYIDHIDTVKGKIQSVAKSTQAKIIYSINNVFRLKERGINLIFPDVDKISEKLLDELKKENENQIDEVNLVTRYDIVCSSMVFSSSDIDNIKQGCSITEENSSNFLYLRQFEDYETAINEFNKLQGFVSKEKGLFTSYYEVTEYFLEENIFDTDGTLQYSNGIIDISPLDDSILKDEVNKDNHQDKEIKNPTDNM